MGKAKAVVATRRTDDPRWRHGAKQRLARAGTAAVMRRLEDLGRHRDTRVMTVEQRQLSVELKVAGKEDRAAGVAHAQRQRVVILAEARLRSDGALRLIAV